MLGHEVEPGDHPPDEVGAEEAGDAADEGPDHVVGGHPVEPQLQEDDQEGEAGAEGEADEGLAGEGAVVPPGPGEGEDDQGAEQDEPHVEASWAEPAMREGNEAEGFIDSTNGGAMIPPPPPGASAAARGSREGPTRLEAGC